MNKKTISFDLWGTLIKSNPEYKIQRCKMVQKYCSKSEQEINQVFESVKKDADYNVENFGVSYKSSDLYNTICNLLSIDLSNAKKIENKCNQLFVQYPPILFKDTINTLSELYNSGYRIIISSNTLLIKGSTLQSVLFLFGLSQFISDYIFSDVVLVSKPNPLFFQQVHIKSLTTKDNIYHVGDNLVTDIVGSRKYGFTPFNVNSTYNPKTLTDFLTFLNK